MHHYGKDHLTASSALALARGDMQGTIDRETAERIEANAAVVRTIAAGEAAVYGINTGFGPLCNTKIDKSQTTLLQRNILLSHSVGTGDPLPEETVRLMMHLKLHGLAQGHSGIELNILKRIQQMLELGIIPVVPSQGSVGASGDLAPLAHLFAPLVGEGEVIYEGKRQVTGAALRSAGLEPIELGPKSGLALINGTQFISAHAVLAVEKMRNLLDHADLCAALMIEGLLGSKMPFRAELHRTRPYPANQFVAARIYRWLDGSEIGQSHADCDRVQDPYSLRCVPQVHGTSRTAWAHLRDLTEIEINSVTDNPVVFSEELTISGGNFHGQPLALPIDYATLAASELGNISDRRIYFSLDGKVNGTPKLLMDNTGVNSGFMMLQYTSAALASENKTLCFPASADSITTSLGQEDHVSMGSIGGRKLLRVLDNLERILAVELVCACQALDFRRPLRSTPPLEAAHALVRERIPHADADRIFAEDIEAARQIIRSGTLRKLTNESNDHSEDLAHFDSY